MMEPDAAPAGGRRNAPPKHSGGAGAPPGGQYEPPARSWLTASTAGGLSQAPDVRRLLTRGRRAAGKARQAYGANTKSAARHRTSVYDCGRSGTKTTANEPGQERQTVRVARREALPHLRKEVRTLNRRRQRPLARHPLASGGERKRRCTRRRKETGRRSLAQSTYRGCLKSESD